VDAAIALQEQAGLEVVTDGEMRRHTFAAPLDEGAAKSAVLDARSDVQNGSGGAFVLTMFSRRRGLATHL